MEKTNTGEVLYKRNYELDFLKLIIAFLVFWTHTNIFIGENTRISLPPQCGSVAVHFFFVVSGMLMANSIVRQGENKDFPGKSAVSFVLRKIKAINKNYLVSLLICLIATIYVYIPTEECTGVADGIITKVTRIFPEVFYVTASGIWLNCSGVTWYLSAMFISMLPLAYLLYKKQEFTLYLFAPLASILLFGYICRSNNWEFIYSDLQGFISGRLFTSMCGLCFGICAYMIFSKIKKANINRKIRIILTVFEIILYLIFFATWFVVRKNTSIMSVILILPIALAITFSQKSYVFNLFRFNWMRHFSSLSLSIYLNHWPARLLVQFFFSGRSYKFCLVAMMLLTALFCFLNYVIVASFNRLWDKKLKHIFIRSSNI